MGLINNNTSKVLLPNRFWEQSKSEDDLKRHILRYMQKNYPYYKVLKVKGKVAICEIDR